MSKLKVWLGDLNYNNFGNEFMLYVPLNIGYVGGYALQQLKEEIELKLFKYPEQMLAQADIEQPDVIGLSFYYWNTNLNHSVTRQLRRKLGGKTIIVWGGPSVDTDPGEQIRLFARFQEVDLFIENEGEIGFANLLRSVLTHGAQWRHHPMDGAVFLLENRLITSGRAVGSILDLTHLESPYLNRLLDPFLDGTLRPIIHTTRMCPYTCSFCVMGKNKGKLRSVPMERVKAEIDYVCDHFRDQPHFPLYIADSNFGILERDAEIADYIRSKTDTVQYPRSVFYYCDKNFGKQTREVVEKLADISFLGLSIALQSENPATLKAVRRHNLSQEEINEAMQWAMSKNYLTTTELIFGLPFETRESFVQLLNDSARRGFDSVLCHNLFIMDGIEMNRESYRKEHGLQTRYRQIGTSYGTIGDDFCAESEEVVVASHHFTFDDFLLVRGLNFMYYTIFTLDFYKWFFQYIHHLGIPFADFLQAFVNPSEEDAIREPQWAHFMEDLKQAVRNELHDTPEANRQHAQNRFILHGEREGPPTRINVYYGARLIYQENSWLRRVLLHLLSRWCQTMEHSNETSTKAEFLLDLCSLERIDLFDEKTSQPSMVTRYDLIAWKNQKFQFPMEHYPIQPSVLSFTIHHDLPEKLAHLKQEISDHDSSMFYFKAMDFIIPRQSLLYQLNYAE
ncbi:MAG: radical SAM protein [Magnetococcus sp. YQC-5]